MTGRRRSHGAAAPDRYDDNEPEGKRLTTRHEQRSGFDDSTRITLLETDCDDFDRRMIGVKDELRKLRQTLIGFALALALAAVAGAANLLAA